jgi:hypothetical protein
VPDIDRYLLPAVGLILVASFVPIAKELLRMRRESQPSRSAGHAFSGEEPTFGGEPTVEVASPPQSSEPGRT